MPPGSIRWTRWPDNERPPVAAFSHTRTMNCDVRLLPFALTLLAMATLGGCATYRGEPVAPAVQQPSTFQQAQGAQVGDTPPSPWWLEMNDPVLVRLIDDALARNNNLAQATVRVRRAQLVAGTAASNQLPTVSVRASTQGSRQLDGEGNLVKTSALTGSVSWELDLWGRLAAARQAAEWEASATVQDRLATAQALVSTTARTYWQVAYLNQRVAASQASIDYARQTLKLVEAQARAGAASGLEVAQARQTVAVQEAAHTQWLQQRVEARNALAILFDGPPGVAMDESQLLPEGALPEVPAGLPASLLTRRPDVLAADLRLRSAFATVDATRAAAYPALTLTGSVGRTTTALSNVLIDPVGTLGAGLTLPFVQWRDVRRNTAISQADYELTVLSYRQTWYTALSEVENALSARRQYEEQGVRLAEAVEAARQAERLSEIRYRSGAVPLKTWLDAQETRRAAENNLALNRYNRLSALATLYQVLGGDMGRAGV